MASTHTVSTRQNTTKYSVGEIVLCYEPDTTKAKVLYESKVLEVDFTKDQKGKKVPEYFVHFSGWNKSWDRWVLEDQILPSNDVNRLKMKRLHEEAINRLKNKKKRKNLVSNSDVSQSSGETSSAKPQQQPVTPTAPSAPCIELEIPSSLKLKLEDDCYLIKRKKKLVRLPRSPNVLDILKEYIDHVSRQEEESCSDAQSSVKIVREVMDGLRIYFDFTLPSLLLYNFERDQYEQETKVHPKAESSDSGEKLGKKSEQPSVVEVVTENTKSTFPEVKEEKDDTSKLNKTPCTPDNTDENSKQDERSSDRVLRRRSKRQKTSSLGIAGSASSLSAPSSSGGERDESLNTCDPNEESIQKGVKRKFSEIASSEKRVSSKPVVQEMTSNILCNSSTANKPDSSGTPSQVYGAEHLLRLFGLMAFDASQSILTVCANQQYRYQAFVKIRERWFIIGVQVKLPSLLAKTTIQENRLSLLLQHLTDFLKYLSSRTKSLFSEDVYQDAVL